MATETAAVPSEAPVVRGVEERAVTAMQAFAIGDALGWPQEDRAGRIGRPKRTDSPATLFTAWRRRTGGRFWSHEEQIGPGEYSDDTQLMLATARSLLCGPRWFEQFCRTELPFWLVYERGGGGATKRATRLWYDRTPPWQADDERRALYFEAGGNGGAMRILPHVLVSKRTLQLDDIITNTIATHGHPRAILGSTIYAVAVHAALLKRDTWRLGELLELILNSRSWQAMPRTSGMPTDFAKLASRALRDEYAVVWHRAVLEAEEYLERAFAACTSQGALSNDHDLLERIGAFDPRSNGSGVVTAVSAAYLASRYAASPRTGLLEAALAYGADTDTLAAMTGALLGAMVGNDWIRPEWRAVQDSNYLVEMGRILLHLAAHPGEAALEPAGDERTGDKIISALVHRPEDVPAGPLGRARVIQTGAFGAGRSGSVTFWRLATSCGQSIIVKHFERSPARGSDGAREEPRTHAAVDSELAALGKLLPTTLTARDLIWLASNINAWVHEHPSRRDNAENVRQIATLLRERANDELEAVLRMVPDQALLHLIRLVLRLRPEG